METTLGILQLQSKELLKLQKGRFNNLKFIRKTSKIQFNLVNESLCVTSAYWKQVFDNQRVTFCFIKLIENSNQPLNQKVKELEAERSSITMYRKASFFS